MNAERENRTAAFLAQNWGPLSPTERDRYRDSAVASLPARPEDDPGFVDKVMTRHREYIAKLGAVTPALGEYRMAREAAARTGRDVSGAKRRREVKETGVEAGRASLAKKRATVATRGKQADASKKYATKQSFMALGPLDSGAAKVPKSLSDDREVQARAEKNQKLLETGRSEKAGRSFDAKDDAFKAYVDTATDGKELEETISNLRPLIKKSGASTTGRAKARKLTTRIAMLVRRKDRADMGSFGVSATAPLMKRSRSPERKRVRSTSSKRAKDASKKPTRATKAMGKGLLEPKKRKTVQPKPQKIDLSRYFF